MTRQIQSGTRLEASNVCIPSGPPAISSQSTGTLSAVDKDTATIDYRFAFRSTNLGPLDWTTTTTSHTRERPIRTARPRRRSSPKSR